jgi:hypothetical protein
VKKSLSTKPWAGRLRIYVKTRLLNKISNGIKRGTIKSESVSAFILEVIEKNMNQGPINYSIHNNRVAVIEVLRQQVAEHTVELHNVERVIMADIEFIKVMEEDDDE